MSTQEIRLTLPIPPSVNASHRNVSIHKRIRTPATVEWMEIAKWTAVAEAKRVKWKISEGEKLLLYLWCYWPDNRIHDCHNMHKVLCDGLEGVLYDNDRYVLVRDVDYAVDKGNPRIEIVLRRKVDDDGDKSDNASIPCVGSVVKEPISRASNKNHGRNKRSV